MTYQPADVFANLRDRLSPEKRGRRINELDLQSALRDVRSISASIPERDAAEAYVLARWRRFDEAEQAADRLLAKWGKDAFTLYHAARAYAQALCYVKAQAAMSERSVFTPGDLSALRNLEHLSMVAASFITAYAAKEELLRIGVPSIEVDLAEAQEEAEWMKDKGITDQQLAAYFQAHVDVVREYMNGQIDRLFATREQIKVLDGEEVLCLDVCVNVDGKTAAQIQWDMAGRDFSAFPESLRDRVVIGIKPRANPGMNE
ncbi:hypothetical protein [Halomonas alkalisoli]|uniref:hypothetical protein n=1 Tax=Halomonas alkalisoli TaxID=2907158 RepID=UPI001F48CFC2|nr:hypothetical protein [Halomonas alkalisoli]MCE9681964.1 hypothetical protein [Halomonas alkalisoli]